ncbi:MAG: TolC family protein [Ignavibacteriales bacterium]|nr:TolC family protein [Ignavibacteriales bacterium]
MNRLLSLALSFFLFSMLSAQTASEKTMTLQQAINAALQNNYSVISAQNTLESNKAGVMASYGRFMPAVSASVGWDGRDMSYPVGSVNSKSASAGVGANVTLFDGLSNTAGLSKSRVAVGASEQDLFRARQLMVLQTQQSYLQVLRNRSLLAVAQENLKQSMRQLDRIVESNKVGAVAIADVYRQQATTARDELAVIQAQSAFDNSKADLLYLLALDVTQDYDFADEWITSEIGKLEAPDASQQNADVNAMMDEALQARPDYQSVLLRKSNAESDITIARSGHMPSLSANAGYSMGNTTFSNISDVKTWSYGLSLSIPIFNGFQTSTRVQSAELALDNAQLIVDQTRRQVQKDLKKAVLDRDAARKKVDVSKKGVVSSLEDRKTAEERYSLGAGTLLDLLVANSNYVSAVNDKVNAEYDYLLAQQQLKFAIGKDKY